MAPFASRRDLGEHAALFPRSALRKPVLAVRKPRGGAEDEDRLELADQYGHVWTNSRGSVKFGLNTQ